MAIETIQQESFTLVVLHGAQTIATFSSLTPTLTSVMLKFPTKDVVLDLTDVPTFDANVIRLLINLNRKLESMKQKLILLCPQDDLIAKITATPGAAGSIAVSASISELIRDLNNEHFKKYLPFTTRENGKLRLRLSCGVCGSRDVYGYLLEQNNYRWTWPADDYFPQCYTKEGQPYDYFNELPIVCGDCLAASINISDFNVLNENDSVIFNCSYNDQTKVFLAKTLKKRKKLIEDSNVVVSDSYFSLPRNRQASYFCYMLAESCARAASINHTDGSMFDVGLFNYLALYFADRDDKQTLIDDCRTWLTQAVATPEIYSHAQLSQSYFIIFVALLSNNKFKDAGKILAAYGEMMKQVIVPCPSEDSIFCPRFWYDRAEAIWKEEIAKKSAALTA